MAKIIWHNQASVVLAYHLEYAMLEFGRATMLRWKKEIHIFEERLKLYPESCMPETLLKDRPFLYRSRHLMNRRFKVVYYYDEVNDIAHIIDIWDTRMNPEALTLRIK